MKFAIASLMMGLSLTAAASSYKAFNSDALQLLTYVQSTCPKEMEEAMLGASMVTSAELVQSPQAPDNSPWEQLTITTSMRHPLISHDVAILKITRRIDSKLPKAPDAGPQWIVTCELKSANDPSF